MKNQTGLLIAAAIACTLSINSTAFAKTAKECTAEWRADKAGMQARGTTEKAYVEQCKGGAEPTAAAPAAKPAEAAPPPAPRQTTATGSKTAKECPVPQPTAATPAAPVAPPVQTNTSSSKTAKECIAEWRADKAGMQARGVTEKAYVEQCKAGGAAPSATGPASQPTAAAPASPSPQAPTATEAAPAPAPQRPAPRTTAAPAPAPTPQPASPRGSADLEAGQFADEASAKSRCPTDTVVWVNLPSKIYHFAGTKNYGTTKRGAFMCEKEAIAAEDRASKTETHP